MSGPTAVAGHVRLQPQALLEHARRAWPVLLVASSAAVILAGLTDAVGEHDGVTAVDRPVAAWFAAHRTFAQGSLGLQLAHATSPAVLIALVLLTAVVLLRRGLRSEALLLTGATVVAYASGAVLKFGEHRARPSSPVNLAPEGEPSYPSGHVLVVAVIAFTVVALAWSHLSRAGRVTAVAVASVAVGGIALDRLVVGAHWLTDLAGSLALAVVIVSVVIAALRLLPEKAA